MKMRLLMPVVLSVIAGLPTATATPPALDAQGASALSSFLTQAVRGGDVPGVVVLLATPDRVLYHEAFGKIVSRF